MHKYFKQAKQRWCDCLVCLCLLVCSMPSLAEVIDLRDLRIELNAEQDVYVLYGEAVFSLTPVLEEAVNHGVPLYFLLEAEVRRPRWYWFDEKAAQLTQTYRLAYSALTRQYRVTISQAEASNLQLRFNTLSDALRLIQHLRNIRLVEPQQLSAGSTYQVQVRMKLDLNQLPKPFQVTALTTREWNLSSEARQFMFTPNANDKVEVISSTTLPINK